MHVSSKSKQALGMPWQKHGVGKTSKKRIWKKQACGVCGMNMHKSNLKRHMIDNHADVVDSICGEQVNWNTFPREYHRKYVTCDVCGIVTRGDYLKRHMASKHVGNLSNKNIGSDDKTTQTMVMDEITDVSKLSENILAPIEQKIVNILEKAITDVTNQVKHELLRPQCYKKIREVVFSQLKSSVKE